MAEGCPKRLIVRGLESEWKSGPRLLGSLFVKWFVKPLRVLMRTLFVHVFPRLTVPRRVMIVLCNAALYDE